MKGRDIGRDGKRSILGTNGNFYPLDSDTIYSSSFLHNVTGN